LDSFEGNVTVLMRRKALTVLNLLVKENVTVLTLAKAGVADQSPNLPSVVVLAPKVVLVPNLPNVVVVPKIALVPSVIAEDTVTKNLSKN